MRGCLRHPRPLGEGWGEGFAACPLTRAARVLSQGGEADCAHTP